MREFSIKCCTVYTLLAGLVLLAACGSNDGGPAGHGLVLGGISHADPATVNCPDCHGPGNSGGDGPACSRCHE